MKQAKTMKKTSNGVVTTTKPLKEDKKQVYYAFIGGVKKECVFKDGKLILKD